MQPPMSPPASADDLLSRCHAIAGLTLGELAYMAHIAIPENLQRHKGWPGMLIEKWLGANAGSKPQQDFPELGIELKTIPIDRQFAPLETTYVCFAPLLMAPGVTWETSNVRNKLQQVLWLPVEGERTIPANCLKLEKPNTSVIFDYFGDRLVDDFGARKVTLRNLSKTAGEHDDTSDPEWKGPLTPVQINLPADMYVTAESYGTYYTPTFTSTEIVADTATPPTDTPTLVAPPTDTLTMNSAPVDTHGAPSDEPDSTDETSAE